MQLLSAGLCMLRNSRFEGGHPLECCTRLVNAPTLSPYIRKDGFNYVIVPVGFISAIERYVSSTYAIATVAASWKDPDRATILWDQDFFLGSIALLADADVHVFTRGVIEASLEASMQQVVEDFPDLLTFSAFNRKLHDRMMEMMPAASDWRSFGYVNLEEALARHRDIRRAARKIARLAVCFAICHEFGHVFTSTVDAEGAQDLSTIETFTDMMGSLVFHRLIEAGILPVIVGSEVTDRDFGHAMAAFHSWNLSKALGSLLHNPVGPGTNAMLERLLEVAMRWDGAMSLIQKVWTDQVPALAHLEDPVSVGHMIMNHWGMMTGGMLRAVLLGKGMPVDIDTACELLSRLTDRESRLYTLMTG